MRVCIQWTTIGLVVRALGRQGNRTLAACSDGNSLDPEGSQWE